MLNKKNGNSESAINTGDVVKKSELKKLETIEKCAEIAQMVSPIVVGALTSLIPGGMIPPVVVTAIAVGAKITAKVTIDKSKEFFIDLLDGEIDGLFEGVNVKSFNKTKSLVDKVEEVLRENYKPNEKNRSIKQVVYSN